MRFQELGRCAEVDPAIFFPADGVHTDDARKVCMSCEVRQECLDWALENNPRGVWGGMGEHERKRYKKNLWRRSRLKQAVA